MMKTAFASAAFALLVALALLAPLGTEALVEFRVKSPSEVAPQFPESITNREALFGVPPYGQLIPGMLIALEAENERGCSTINRTATIPSWPTSLSDSIILLIKRGDCHFVDKVRNAQAAGAQAVVIYDDVNSYTLPYLADDGSGGEIRIPSLIISKNDGDKLYNAVRDQAVKTPPRFVFVTLHWGVPHPDNRVEWDLWTSSSDTTTMRFLKNFAKTAEKLGSSIQLTPHWYIINGTSYNCVNSDRCGNQCTNKGRYCAVDPDHDLEHGVSGAQVLQENVRQHCVFQVANNTGHPERWWNYMTQYLDRCPTYSAQCSRDLQQLVGISTGDVDRCLTQAGPMEIESEADNAVLRQHLDARQSMFILKLPTILINNRMYYGGTDCPEPVDLSRCGVFEMLCAGFSEAPAACQTQPGCPPGQVRDECGVCGGDGSFDKCGKCLSAHDPNRRDDVCQPESSSGVATSVIIIVVVLAVALVAGGAFFYVRRMQQRLRSDVASIMEQYVSLPDNAFAVESSRGRLISPHTANSSSLNPLPRAVQPPPNDGQEL